MHAMQGNGETAGHTTDVAGIVTLQVEVLKNINIDGLSLKKGHGPLVF